MPCQRDRDRDRDIDRDIRKKKKMAKNTTMRQACIFINLHLFVVIYTKK